MMLTFRARKVVALAVFLSLVAACSREQQDWRSAEASDTVDGYSQFLERHPDSELATEARTRVAQLSEDREWQHASQAGTADAYRQFLAQHPNGKWSQEARIRIQNFALNGLPPAGSPPTGQTPGVGSAAVGGDTSGGTSGGASPGTAQLSPPARPQAAMVGTPTPTIALSTPYVSSPNPALANATHTNTVSGGAVADASSGYGIQLGAFTSEDAANSAWQRLTARFGAQLQGLSAHIVSANTATGTLFRLQAPVGDQARARALCDMLRKQSQACVPVLPH